MTERTERIRQAAQKALADLQQDNETTQGHQVEQLPFQCVAGPGGGEWFVVTLDGKVFKQGWVRNCKPILDLNEEPVEQKASKVTLKDYVEVNKALQAAGVETRGITGVGSDRHIILTDGRKIQISR